MSAKWTRHSLTKKKAYDIILHKREIGNGEQDV